MRSTVSGYRVAIYQEWAIPQVAAIYEKDESELKKLWEQSKQYGVVCAFEYTGESKAGSVTPRSKGSYKFGA